jgi:hypothetical protein
MHPMGRIIAWRVHVRPPKRADLRRSFLCLDRSACGQPDREPRTMSIGDRALDANAASEGFNDAPRHGEAETRTAVLSPIGCRRKVSAQPPPLFKRPTEQGYDAVEA